MLVELALLLPLIMLLIIGGLFMGVMMVDRLQLTWMTAEGARAAAGALTDAERCPDTLAAVQAVSGRVYQACDGSEGLYLEVDPLTAMPRAVRVTITDRLGAPPIISFATDGTVSVTAGAVIAPLSP